MNSVKFAARLLVFLWAGILSISASAADTMYWYKNADSTDFFALENWRPDSESGKTQVTGLATNVGDTAVFQKCIATIDVPAATKVEVGNLTVGIPGVTATTKLTMNFGKDAALVGSGTLSFPNGPNSYKTFALDYPQGGVFSFANGVTFGRRGYMDFTGTDIVVTNTPRFTFTNETGDNRLTFPAGTKMYDVEVSKSSNGGTFTFSVAGPNSILKGFKYDWNWTQAIVQGDSLVAITNGVTMTDVNMRYFAGCRNELRLHDVTADYIQAMQIKDKGNLFDVRCSTLTGPYQLSILGETNTAVFADSEITATCLDAGSNAAHYRPHLILTNSTVRTASLALTSTEGRYDILDSDVEVSATGQTGFYVGGPACTGMVMTIAGPKTRVRVPSNTTITGLSSGDTSTDGSGNTLVISNQAVFVAGKLRIGGRYDVKDLTMEISSGAVVTNLSLLRMCNTGTSARGGERCKLVINGGSFVEMAEARFGGSNNLVRVANGGLFDQSANPNSDNEIVGGKYTFEADDGTMLFKRGLPLSSDPALPSILKIGGARGRVSCEKLNSVGAEVVFSVPETGRTITEPMLTLTQFNAAKTDTLFPSEWNVSIKFDLPDGLTRESAGVEYVDLIDISHNKGQLGAFLELTNTVDKASLKGNKLEYTTGSGGVENGKLRLCLRKEAREGGLVIILE